MITGHGPWAAAQSTHSGSGCHAEGCAGVEHQAFPGERTRPAAAMPHSHSQPMLRAPTRRRVRPPPKPCKVTLATPSLPRHPAHPAPCTPPAQHGQHKARGLARAVVRLQGVVRWCCAPDGLRGALLSRLRCHSSSPSKQRQAPKPSAPFPPPFPPLPLTPFPPVPSPPLHPSQAWSSARPSWCVRKQPFP